MPVEFKDYYATLGVPRTASAAEIKKAFRSLARKHHPDVAADKQSAEGKFKEINEAYQVLGDPEKRKKYDALGADWQSGVPFGGQPRHTAYRGDGRGGMPEEFHFHGTGFSDFFEQFFSGGGRRGFAGEAGPFEGAPRSRRGDDLESDILVTLDEAMHGTIRTITLQSTDPRTGKSDSRSFQVRIPAGIANGKRIRVPGHGSSGAGGADPGDLYLRVRHAAHPDFHTRGHDVYRDLDLTPWEAVLGAEISVGTLDGDIRLRIQPGTEAGHTLRVRGRGLPTGKPDIRGDLLVVVHVRLPTTLSDEERTAWEQLRDASKFDPRKP